LHFPGNKMLRLELHDQLGPIIPLNRQ